MRNELSLPTLKELLAQGAGALTSYRRAVRRELARARKHRPTGARRSLQSRVAENSAAVSVLSEHVRMVEKVISVKN